MQNLVIVILGLGVGAGVLWYRLDKARAPDAAQETAEPQGAAPAVPLRPDTGPGPASQGTHPAVATPIITVPLTPADLAKRAGAREMLQALLPDLATELELSTEDADRFLDLLARQQVEISEVSGARNLRVLELSGESEQAAMLGEAYPRWQEYQSDTYERDHVDQLQKILINQDMRLTDDEINPLVDALAAEQRRLTQELVNASQTRGQDAREMLQLQLDRADSSNRRLVEVASRHLRPQQLALYEQMLQQRVQGMRRKLRLMDLAANQ
jgi:hypothetical protein